MHFTRRTVRYQRGCIPSGSSRGESVLFPFAASRSHLYCWLTTPSSICKASNVVSSNLFLTLGLLVPFYRDACNYLRPIWIISPTQNPYPITFAKLLLPCNVTNSKDYRTWTFWGKPLLHLPHSRRKYYNYYLILPLGRLSL